MNLVNCYGNSRLTDRKLLKTLSSLIFSLQLLFPGHPRADEATQPTSIDPILRVTPLDNARSQPQRSGPPVEVALGYTTTLMHHASESGQKIVELRVPEEYLKSNSRWQSDNIGFFFFTSYPPLKGAFAVGNEKLLSCIGYCGGRMIIGLRNQVGDNWSSDAQWRSVLRMRNGEIHQNIAVLGGFDEAEMDTKIAGGHRVITTYYVKYGQRHIVSSYVSCSASAPNPTCEEWLSLPSHSEVGIHYTFPMRLLKDWNRIHASVVALVESFFVQTLKYR